MFYLSADLGFFCNDISHLTLMMVAWKSSSAQLRHQCIKNFEIRRRKQIIDISRQASNQFVKNQCEFFKSFTKGSFETELSGHD